MDILNYSTWTCRIFSVSISLPWEMLLFLSYPPFFYDHFCKVKKNNEKTLSRMEVRLNMFSNWVFSEAWNELKSVYPKLFYFWGDLFNLKAACFTDEMNNFRWTIVYKSSGRFNSKWLWTNQKRNENCFEWNITTGTTTTTTTKEKWRV